MTDESNPIPTADEVKAIDVEAAKAAGIPEERLAKASQKNPLPADILAISRGHRLLSKLDPKTARAVAKYLYESFGSSEPVNHAG